MRGVDEGITKATELTAAVHPHMRGVDGFLLYHFHSPFGSPPHAWGRLDVDIYRIYI